MAAWLLPALMMGGSLLGKAGKGAAQERQNQNQFQLQNNQLAQSAHNADTNAMLAALQQNEGAKMNRAQLGISAPQARMKQALLGSLIQNARTARYTPPAGVRMGQVSGGFDLDTLINALGRKAGGTMQAQATSALETGSDIPAYEDATSRLRSSPVPSGYKKPGMLETLLSVAGMVGGGAGVANSLRNMPPEMDRVSRAGFGV